MLRRIAPLALAAAFALPDAAGAAEPDNLVPNGDFARCSGGSVVESWRPGREFYEPIWATSSTVGCDSGAMRIATNGGESGLHWQIEGGRSDCVETPGISTEPRPISFRYRPHVHAVQFGLIGAAFTLYAVAYEGAGCTGTAAPRTLYHAGGAADTWYEASGSIALPDGTDSVAFEVASGCPVGVTCLKESGGDASRILVDNAFVGGDGMVVTDCADPELDTVTEVEGDLVIQNVTGCGELELPSLVEVGGDLIIETTDATAIDVGSVTVGGDLSISGNESVGVIGVGNGAVAGTVSITDNTGAGVVDVGSSTVGNDLSITGNTSAGVVDVGSSTVGGDLDISGNGVAGTVSLGDLDQVAGEVTIETGGESLGGVTGGTVTDLSIFGGVAAMHVTLPDGAFSLPVGFRIERRGDEPAAGRIDPIAAYAFTFGVPTLGAPARLDFTVELSRLDAATRAALLAGVTSDGATLAVRGDQGTAQYQALPRCKDRAMPETGDCVRAVVLGAGGRPLAPGEDAAFIRFEGVVGHFSTYAVALVERPPGDPLVKPSNAFRFGKLRLNRRRGTASLAVVTAGPGRIVLRGRGVRRATRSVAGTRASVPVRLSGAAKRRLHRRGRVTVRLTVVYTPAGGAPRSRTKRVTLVKGRKLG